MAINFQSSDGVSVGPQDSIAFAKRDGKSLVQEVMGCICWRDAKHLAMKTGSDGFHSSLQPTEDLMTRGIESQA